MFVVVKEASSVRKSRIGRKRVETATVKEYGVGFPVMSLQKADMINNPKVRSALEGKPILLSKGIKDACKWSCREVSTWQYESVLFMNGMRQILANLPDSFKRKQVVLIDIKGKYQQLADCLAEKFSHVRIVTACPELYQYYVDEKLYECGVALTVSDRLLISDDVVCCVSPDGIMYDEICRAGMRLFVPRRTLYAKGCAVHSFRAELPQRYRNLLGDEADATAEFMFTSALYLYCGLRIPEILMPVKVSVNDEYYSIDEAKIHIFTLDTE